MDLASACPSLPGPSVRLSTGPENLYPTRGHNLSVAITAISDDDVVWIAQNLRNAPELCGALRDKDGSVRRKLRREREAALAAAAGLWHATMDLRARIKQERLRVVSPQEASKELGEAKAQPQAVPLVGNLAAETPEKPPALPTTEPAQCAKELQGASEADGISGTAPQLPAIEPVEAAASEAAESFAAALAEVVEECGASIGDDCTQERIAAMRAKIKNHVAAFASDADPADLISPALMPKRVA